MVGWENYIDLWTDPVAWQALQTTLDLRRGHRSIGVVARPWHGAGDERGVSRSRSVARRRARSLGYSHRGLFTNVALHFQ